MFDPIVPKADEFVRPRDLHDTTSPEVLYARSYLWMRAVVGGVGLVLPIALWIMEASFARSVEFRGSISAYYHTPAREIFVALLSVVVFLLVMYMAGQKRPDKYLSTVAGFALAGVIALPTWRPGVEDSGLPQCGSEPKPISCSNLQQLFGESTTAVIHSVCAAVCFVCLSLICFFWARWDMGVRRKEAAEKGQPEPSRRELWRSARVWVPVACGALILLAILWVPLGWQLGSLTSLYVGEVVAILAFATAWLYSAWDLAKALLLPAPKRKQAERPEPALGGT